MSSVNPHYTFQYSQPDDYHYSHDSVFLAREVFKLIKNQKIRCESILDLCAGCGVVGMDLLVHLSKDPQTSNSVNAIDFLEIQSVYMEHFEANKQTLEKLLPRLANIHFLNGNYNEITAQSKKYDLIISNPPYFRFGHGTLSSSEFKNRCRFFIDANFRSLLECISFSLKSDGRAYILLKSLARHGIDIKSELAGFQLNLNIRHIGLVRETDFYEISLH